MKGFQKFKRSLILVLLCFTTFANAQEYARLVDTRIGTKGNGLGSGYNFPGATFPFGMVQFTPSYFSPQKGFVINQLSGAGCPHMGNFPVIPIAGILKESPGNMEGYEPYQEITTSMAGHFGATMGDGTSVDLTANKRSGIARFKFDESAQKGTVILGSGIASTFVNNARVEITSKRTMEGFADGGEFCGTNTNYRIYFAVEFNQDASLNGTWVKNALLKDEKSAFGKDSGAFFTFDLNSEKEVLYRIAVSYVSIENAKENLASDNTYDSFEEYQGRASDVWNKHLGKIEVSSENKDRQSQFYTHLYHSLIHPNIVNDVNGDYMGADFKVYNQKDREVYSSFSVWDTYRTQAQLVAMFFPEESSDMVQSLVKFAEQSGGYGRWILANIETGIMHGDPTPILIANSYVFGAQNFDLERAYKYMKKGATVPLLRSQDQEVRPHLTEYLRDGHTFASMMLEYTSADFAIGQYALQALDKKEDALYFTNRSQNWKNIYNPENNWLNSRYPNGKWKDITHDWREGTYKNYFWMIPYNLEGLIDTIGGKEYAENRLDVLFERLDASYDDDWFASGNEPDFHVPWVYNWTNNPNKSSVVVHRILDEMYNSSPSGLPGNDDLGTMGAWYVFASVGLYPMIPGVAGFSTSTPQFETIKLKLPKGDLLITGGGLEKPFISKLSLDGKNQKSSWIPWNKLEKGGTLKFKTSGKPQKSWGTEVSSPSFESIK